MRSRLTLSHTIFHGNVLTHPEDEPEEPEALPETPVEAPTEPASSQAESPTQPAGHAIVFSQGVRIIPEALKETETEVRKQSANCSSKNSTLNYTAFFK